MPSEAELTEAAIEQAAQRGCHCDFDVIAVRRWGGPTIRVELEHQDRCAAGLFPCDVEPVETWPQWTRAVACYTAAAILVLAIVALSFAVWSG